MDNWAVLEVYLSNPHGALVSPALVHSVNFQHPADNDDIANVYESLLKGSRNHLRSFTKTLQQQTGEIYTPQYLGTDAYDAIIGTGIEAGGQGNGGNGNRNRRGNHHG